TRQAAGLQPGPGHDVREDLFHPGPALPEQRRALDRVAAQVDILPDGHLAEQAVTLRHVHHAEIKYLPRALANERLAAERDAARARLEQAADGREQRGLA